jgi:hypothetical protein
MSSAKLDEARVLCRKRRYGGAYYLCGYAVELRLKARIVDTLKWPGFPEDQKDTGKATTNSPQVVNIDLRLVQVHDLDRLLHLSGRMGIKQRHLNHWSVVLDWKSTCRYDRTGTRTKQEAEDMINATSALIKAL